MPQEPSHFAETSREYLYAAAALALFLLPGQVGLLVESPITVFAYALATLLIARILFWYQPKRTSLVKSTIITGSAFALPIVVLLDAAHFCGVVVSRAGNGVICPLLGSDYSIPEQSIVFFYLRRIGVAVVIIFISWLAGKGLTTLWLFEDTKKVSYNVKVLSFLAVLSLISVVYLRLHPSAFELLGIV